VGITVQLLNFLSSLALWANGILGTDNQWAASSEDIYIWDNYHTHKMTCQTYSRA
jgi:hypothetical protein